MRHFIKGVDLSTYKELDSLGAKYYDHGKEEPVLEILKRYDMDTVRIRIWNDPYSDDGKPYGAGTNDVDTSLYIGKKVTEAGYGVLLDFQYSDFWADPGKQYKPKAWKNYNVAQLEQAVYDFTLETMQTFLEAGVNVTLVQVGNELTNGLLWPEGKKPEYDNIAKFVNAGIKAVRKSNTDIPVMIHLDNGGNNEMYRDWFDHFIERGEPFEYIGLSYYPFWHGTLDMLEANMRDLAARYGKKMIVAEVSMGFSMEDYRSFEQLSPEERKGYATRKELTEGLDYPMTKDGQCGFMADFLSRISKIPNELCEGFFYWEPAWIPVAGSGWATEAALKYIEDPGPGGNEWANQALFDYQGNALPSLGIIRDFKAE